MPATLTLTKKGVAAAGEDAAAALETAAGGACRWRLRQGGPVVICPSAADVVGAFLEEMKRDGGTWFSRLRAASWS